MDRQHGSIANYSKNEFPIHTDSRKTRSDRRKRALFEILDALEELRNHSLEEPDEEQKSFSQDVVEDLSTENQRHSEGAQVFHCFQKHTKELDKKLENLTQAFRHAQIGSAGIISSSSQLRLCLSTVQVLFSDNAIKLFPDIKRDYPAHAPLLGYMQNLECFPEELDQLACDLITFQRDLREFPEVVRENLDVKVVALEHDLKFWASCLQDFKGHFRDPAVQRYMHALCGEMDKHIFSITNSISSFVEAAVPAAQLVQQQTATILVSLSGLATFVSAVTATGIQISYAETSGALAIAVNTFWFSSLVFSIASAVNSLLGLVWMQAPYRSPLDRVPWWISIWIKHSPLLFLVVALATFSIGLVLFTWATQDFFTYLMTTIFTGMSFFSLFAVSVWFALEHSVFIQHKGQRLLADVIADFDMNQIQHVIQHFIKGLYTSFQNQLRTILQRGSGVLKLTWRACYTWVASQRVQDTFDTTGSLPLSTPSPMSTTPLAARQSLTSAPSPTQRLSTTTRAANTPPAPVITSLTGDGDLSASAKTVGFGSTILQGESPPASGDSKEPFTALQQISRLRTLQTTEIIPAHPNWHPIYDLQFSLCGNWLVTSRWDETKIWCSDMEPFSLHQTLDQSEPIKQVAWTPTGPKARHLLTTQSFKIKIWTEDGVCVNTIERPLPVQSVVWLPSGEAFLSHEGNSNLVSRPSNEVHVIDLKGNIMASHILHRLNLCAIAVTPDGHRMLGVANVFKSTEGPHTTANQARIVVYNLTEKAIESQVPVAADLDSIAVSSNGQFALVSSTWNKNPAQLWRLKRVQGVVRLSLLRTYMPNADFHATSPSYFGGKSDQLILCGGKNGHVLVWDRDSGDLLHHLHEPDGNVKRVTWNHASDSPMLATGSTDGRVRIWSLPQQGLTSDFSQSAVL